MKKAIVNSFNYISNIWLGQDQKPSVKRVLAIIFAIHMLFMISRIIYKWEGTRAIGDSVGILYVEGTMVLTLLGITSAENVINKKTEAGITKFLGTGNIPEEPDPQSGDSTKIHE